MTTVIPPDASKEERAKLLAEHFALAMAQERHEIVKRLYQMKLDCDSFNENVGGDVAIVFDFTNDMAELEAAGVLSVKDIGDPPQ